jgi:exosome complex RNA-binding protein Csl4
VTASQKGVIMQNDKKIENNSEVCNKIFDYVDKPDNYLMCKAMNVYDDRYRVNVFVKEEVEDITGHKQYISNSYFCRYNGTDLTILS